MMKRFILALAMLTLLAVAFAEAADFPEHVGWHFNGDDPWGGALDVTVRTIEGGRMAWTFTDTFDGTSIYQEFEGTELTNGAAAFHTEGVSIDDDGLTFAYDGTIALVDKVVVITFTGGQIEKDGVADRVIAELDADSRKAVLRREPMGDPVAINRYSDVWVADGVAVEIWYDDDAFHCRAVLGNGGDESRVYEYGACEYDDAADCLTCADGTRTHEIWDNAAEELKTEIEATGLTAGFTFVDDEAYLVWNRAGEGLDDIRLKRLSDAEEDDWLASRQFIGRWMSGRCTIGIVGRDDGSFQVNITWGNSASEQVEWRYDCAYDGERKALYSYEPGTKATVTYGEDGEIVSSVEEYGDGEATFAIDGDGMLIWNDAKENAAADMRFERVEVADGMN